jgi:hypothetical protein
MFMCNSLILASTYRLKILRSLIIAGLKHRRLPFPLLPLSGGRRSAATRTGVSDRADLVPMKPKTSWALTTLSFTPAARGHLVTLFRSSEIILK